MQEYYSETIVGMVFLIVLLLLLVAGLSSELIKHKRAAKSMHDRLNDVLTHGSDAVKNEYKK